MLLFVLAGWAAPSHAANLQVSEFSDTGSDPTPAGGVITYEVTVLNSDLDTVDDTFVLFDLPPGATAVNLPANCSVDPVVSTRVVCSLGSVTGTDPPTPTTFQLQVSTAGLAPGTVVTTAAIGHAPLPPATTPLNTLPPSDPFFAGDTNVGDNVVSQNTTLIDAGDLALTKTASPNPVVAGTEVTYTVTVVNNGPSPSSNFAVNDVLPAGTTFVPGSASGTGWTFNAQNGTFAGPLAVGASATYTFRATVTAASGDLVNTATVTANGTPDPNPGNNTGSATVTVAAGADLQMTKTAAPVPALPGQLITFELTVTNNGPSPAAAVNFSDPMPAGFIIQSTTAAAGWVCTTPGDTAFNCVLTPPATLAVGESATFTVTALVPSTGPGSSGNQINTATVDSPTPDPVPGNNAGTVNFTVIPDGADLALTKSKSPSVIPIWPGPGPTPPAGSGYIATSTINVTNNGPRPATGDVQVVDVLAPGEEYFPSDTTPWTCSATPYAAPPAQQVVTCTLNASALPLPVGPAPPLRIQSFAHPEADGTTLTNNACTGGSGGSSEPTTDGGVGDQEPGNDCNGSGVRPSPLRSDLSVTKQTNGAGDADNTLPIDYTGMSYTIVVSNAGPDATIGVILEDTLPGFLPGRTSASVTAPPGWTCTVSGTGTLNCQSGTTPLPPGPGVSIVVNLTGPLADSASRAPEACGAITTPAGSWCNRAGVAIDPNVAGSSGEVDVSNNQGADFVRVPRVANVQTTAKTIVTGSPGAVGQDTVYRIDYTNQGPSLAPAVVFRDVISLVDNDPGFLLTVISRTGAGAQNCNALTSPTVAAQPGAGGIIYTTVGSTAGTVTIVCTPLDMPGGQTESLNVTLRPRANLTSLPTRVYNNLADFFFDYDNDGNADLSGGIDGNGAFEYNDIDTDADDEKSASLTIEVGDVDLIVNKLDVGFPNGVDPLGYDPTDPSANFITYQITVQNLGPSVATGVVVTDTITPPPGRTVQLIGESDNPNGPFQLTAGICQITGSNPTTGAPLQVACLVPGAGFPNNVNGVIAPGATSTAYLQFQYQSQPGAGGDTILNVASADSIEPEADAANNTENETTSVRSRVDLGVTKHVVSGATPPAADPNAALPPDITTVSIREPFYFVFDVVNNGPGNSVSLDRTGSSPLNGDGTIISDSLPPGVVVTGAATWQKVGPAVAAVPDGQPNGSGACLLAGQNLSCSAGDVTFNPGQPGRVRVIVPVRFDTVPAGGTVNNTATVTTQQVDNVPGNNTSTVPITVTASSLAGTVFQDRDRSTGNGGIPQDASIEPRIPGVVLALSGVDAFGNPVNLNATTDANGDYLFADLSPSNASGYTIVETQPAGFVNGPIDPPTTGPQAPSLGGNYARGTPDSSYAAISVPAATAGVRYHFPELSNASLSGFLYVDADFNNVRTVGTDPVIAGATVELLNAGTSTVVQTVTADANGAYLFSNLDPNVVYTLREPLPTGTFRNRPSAINPGTINGVACTTGCTPGTAVGGDAATTDRISVIDLSAGVGTGEGLNFNFGEEPSGSSLSGRVWLDISNDGTIDGAETGIASVTVTLTGTDQGGVAVNQSITTDANGNYLFAGLVPGTYTITEPDQPPGTLNGATVAGNAGGTATDVLTVPSAISAIALGLDQAGINYDFGEIPAASIRGRVYYDNNKNGVVDADETGIPNVTITLEGDDDLPTTLAAANAITPLAAVAARSVVSDASGNYVFDNLRPGTYTVTEPDQPPDTTNGVTTAGTVNGAPMGVATPIEVVPSAISNIVLLPGQTAVDENFGEVADTPDLVVSKSADPARFTVNNAATYTIRVRNIGPRPTAGQYQVDDRLPVGVTLAAVPTGNGWTCAGAVGADRFSCTSQTLILNGATSPDTITVPVTVGAAAAPASPVHNAVIVRGGGEDAAHSPSAAEQGAFDGDVTQLPLCDPAITQNACRIQSEVQAAASLSGTVWFDVGSEDALLDGGDQRLQGWTVEVLDQATGTVVRTGTTAADGSYRFEDLLPATRFLVRFRHPQSGVLWGFPVTGETAAGPAAPCQTDAAVASGTASTCRVDENGITQLEVVLRSGDNLPQQSLPVDPSGVVYDAVSRDPVPNSIVTLAPVGICANYDPATSILNGGQGGYNVEGNNISMQVGSDGYYLFLFGPGAPPRCEFSLTVTPPGGYTFRSSLIPPEGSALSPPGAVGTTFQVQPQPTPPTGPVGPATTYYLGLFAGSGTANIVHNHLPLDPSVPPGLVITKTGDRQIVEVGDTLLYTITIRQTAGEALDTVNVVDNLPPGFTYIDGTARADGRGIADPLGKPGPRLVFNVGPIRPGQQIQLSYRVRIGVGSMQGDGINRAQAFGCSIDGGCVDPGTLQPLPGTVPSNRAQYRVRVTGGVFTDEGCVLGKIFVDGNNNHVQDSEELGIPGVRFYFEDGTWMVSDSEGKYSYCGLPPKSHTLKVDASTLPTGSRLTTSSNRNLGDANSLFIDLKNGELHRADFIEGSGSNEVLEQVKARRTQGETSAPETEIQGAPLSFQTQPLGAPSGATTTARQLPSIVAPRGTARPAGVGIGGGIDTRVPATTADAASPTGDVAPSSDIAPTPIDATPATEPVDHRFEPALGTPAALYPQTPSTTGEPPHAVEVQSGNVDYSVNTDVEIVRVDVDRDGVPADGQSPVHVIVQLLGEDERPLAGERFATIEYSGGRVQLPGGRTDELGPGRLDADRVTPGIQLPVKDGRAEFDLLAPDVPQDVLLRITAGGVAAENTVSFLPEMRDLLATGLIEGVVNFRNGGSLDPVRRDDGFDRDIRRWEREFNSGKANAAARTAFFVKGTIKGEYLLTAAYDSDKEVRGRLLRDIRPEEFYPVYGDSSLRGFDAQSAERLYVRIDKNRSYLLYGDFQTGDSLASQTGVAQDGKIVMRSLGNYNRTATGFGWHFEGKRVRGNVFAMEDSLRQVIDEFPSQGSGPYGLSNSAVLEGSERVEVVTRDRNQPSRIITVRPLARLVDYSFEPFSGRILLNQFLPGFDSELNPISLRITYELDQGTEKFWVYGVDAQFRLTKNVEAGAAYVNDENPFAPFRMGSANLGFRFGKNTWMVLEAARTESEVNTNSINQFATPGLKDLSGEVEGDAYRLEFGHDGKTFDASVFAGRSDPAFNNPSSPLYGGRGEYDLELTWAVNERFEIYVEALRSEDRNPDGGDRNAGGAGVRIDATKRLTLDLGVRSIRETIGAYSPWSISPPFGGTGGLSGGFATGAAGGALGYGQQPLDPLTGLPVIRSEGTVPNSDLPIGTELESDTVHAGAGYKINDKFVIGGEYEQDVNGEDRNRVALGVDYRLKERNRLYGRYEKQTGLASAYGITTTDREADALVFGIDSTYVKDTQVFSEYRMRDAISGRDVQMASGIRNDWDITEGLRLSTAAEHVKIYDGDTGDTTALAFGLDYSANPLWRGAMRLEYRVSGDVEGTATDEEFNTTLFQLLWARKLNRDWTLLARNYLLATDYQSRGDVLQDRFQLGVAYRDTDHNRINALARYEYKIESDKSGIGIAGLPQQNVGQDIRTAAHILSTHADWHPSRPWWLTGRVAAKWQEDRFSYNDGGRVDDRFRGVLVSGRVVYDITENWDVGVLASTFQGDYDANQYAYGVEIGRLLRQNLWLSVGYNFVGFEGDPDLTGYEYTDEGAFIRLRFKFDENLFQRDDDRYRKPAQK
ncbi:SdrD B-like domain-containing protein [Lysobacter panacisoli]|uniref:SdrD B-like domain-containing protein n=1 Tax=Lysobacter panacisoli TaxID=1255263 RepID=UPI00131CE826|nr:SdrD B-like domain-containing protein [Lysobacter panacisoli]